MATVKWAAAPTSRGTVLTTELNSLANGSFTAVGPAYDNTANLDEWFWLEFLTGGSITPTAGANVQIFATHSPGGTNYGDAPGANNVGFQDLIATLPLTTAAGTQRATSLFPVQLPPGKFKFILKNNAGVALSATSNTLTLYSANESVA